MLVIFLGESLNGGSPGNPFKHPLPVQFEFLGIFAVWIGLILGWKWERIAGFSIIIGVVVFHIIEGEFWINLPFGLFGVTGVMFLFLWWLGRNNKLKKFLNKANQPDRTQMAADTPDNSAMNTPIHH